MILLRLYLWLAVAIAPGCGLVSILLPSYSNPVNKALVGRPSSCEDVDEVWRQTGEIVVIASFSGGGKRAAAFAYGVMLGLEHITLQLQKGQQSNLLEQVDLISAVSGGAIPAIHYGRRNASSNDWHQTFSDFLFEDTEFWLLVKSLNPVNWFSSSSVIAAKHFGSLFEGQTFANLSKSPHLLIGATDISRGQPFIFSETQFRCIGSDLDVFPLGYAAAASAAFPVYFSAIALKNFNSGTSPEDQEYHELRERAKGPFIPLLDGGLVDNLAVRAYLDQLLNRKLLGGKPQDGRPPAKGFIFIQVDGSAHLANQFDDTRKSPNLFTRTTRSFDVTFEQQIRDTEWEVRGTLRKLDDFYTNNRDFRFVNLRARLKDVTDMTLRDVPTAWSLDEQQVNALIEAGKQAVTGNSRDVGRIQALFGTFSP